MRTGAFPIALFFLASACTETAPPPASPAAETPTEQAPDVLADRAREISKRLGYADASAASRYLRTHLDTGTRAFRASIRF